MTKQNFKNLDALESVSNVINEASRTLNDKSATIITSPLSEIVGAALHMGAGAGAGAAAGFAALYGLGTAGLSAAGITSGLATAGSVVGGGMVAGIGVLAAPAVILGAGAVAIYSHNRAKRLNQEKRRLYQAAVSKQNAIIEELRNEVDMSKDRADLLEGLNVLLKQAIKDLREDLGDAV